MIKTFSPFARAYAPLLAQLPNPIPEEVFIEFIDGLNNAFLSSPIFQAAHVVGGTLLSTQILSAQAVGGVFQVALVLGSAGVSMLRVSGFVKKANAGIFEPRGLDVKIMSTKEMMAAIGCRNMDGKGKLVLPPLEILSDLTPAGVVASNESKAAGEQKPIVEDPRLRRLRALEGYVAPLEFQTAPLEPKGIYQKYGGAPLRWLNKRQDAKLAKAAEKSAQKRQEMAPNAEAEIERSDAKIAEIERKIQAIYESLQNELAASFGDRYRIEAHAEEELGTLEASKTAEIERRDKKIVEIYKKGDKKLEKLAKKEEKIANRILWVVVLKVDADNSSELLEVGSIGSSN